MELRQSPNLQVIYTYRTQYEFRFSAARTAPRCRSMRRTAHCALALSENLELNSTALTLYQAFNLSTSRTNEKRHTHTHTKQLVRFSYVDFSFFCRAKKSVDLENRKMHEKPPEALIIRVTLRTSGCILSEFALAEAIPSQKMLDRQAPFIHSHDIGRGAPCLEY